MSCKDPKFSRQKAEAAAEWFLKAKSVSDTVGLGWLSSRKLDTAKWREIAVTALVEATDAAWEWHLDSGGKDISNE